MKRIKPFSALMHVDFHGLFSVILPEFKGDT
jgi:hypothetical protein